MNNTYKKCGVNRSITDGFTKHLKSLNPDIGGFSGLVPVNSGQYIAASMDGVGTKLLLAQMLKRPETIGIDLVAMNVNDIICCGAKPISFLDHISFGKFDPMTARLLIKGIIRGCSEAGCVLSGGETSEMPGFYGKTAYELSGTAIGIVSKKEIVDGRKIIRGDILIGLPSSGIHSNGFSLIRKIFSKNEINKYSDILLEPTKIYAKTIMNLLNEFRGSVKGMAHITGGGMLHNICRVLPVKRKAHINKGSWVIPEIFYTIALKGGVSEKEMHSVFNMGIGMVLIVSKNSADKILLAAKGSNIIGEVR